MHVKPLNPTFFLSYLRHTFVIKRHQKWSPTGDSKAKIYKELLDKTQSMDGIGKNLDLIENKKFTDAIISDNRIKILKNLAKKRMTVAELTRQIGVQKNAIYKHLDKLIDAQIIRRIENDERKWVYYELTEKGAAIVSSKRLQIFVIISSGIGTLFLGIFLMARYFSMLAEISGRGEKRGGELPSEFDIGLVFIIISAVLFSIAFFMSKSKWKNIDENLL